MLNTDNNNVSVTFHQFCSGVFYEFLNYCRELNFEDKPNYAFLKKLFRDAYIQHGFDCTSAGIPIAEYDWSKTDFVCRVLLCSFFFRIVLFCC